MISPLQLVAAIAVAILATWLARALVRFERADRLRRIQTRQYREDTAIEARRFALAVGSSVSTPVPRAPLKFKERGAA
jgi:hypothetical protein